MSINIVEKLQQDLGYPPLKKIDPNTQHVVTSRQTGPEYRVSQAAIPAVLTGFYKYVQTDEGASAILRGGNSTDWVSKIFADTEKEVIQKISGYAGQSTENTVNDLNKIANETIRLVNENMPATATIKEAKLFFKTQKNNILLYLPAELNMGESLHDTTLDDKTNKMEGPISNLMKNLGAAFTQPVADEEVKHP